MEINGLMIDYLAVSCCYFFSNYFRIIILRKKFAFLNNDLRNHIYIRYDVFKIELFMIEKKKNKIERKI
jgi:hypothetical protein